MFETRKEEASVEEIRELKERLERERPVEWEAFPDIGLYMDQLISYMPRQLIHYGEGESLTSAMVNNYIKDGAMPRAEGKRYSRTHLAYQTALFALSSGLNVLCYEVSAFNDNLLFLGRYFKYLALLALVFAGHDLNVIACLDV